MDWLILASENQLGEIIQKSFEPHIMGVLLFKHSTRCSISSMALDRLERNWTFSNELFPAYHLDLLKHQHLSAEIAAMFNVRHQSPQVLVIKNGKCIYNASHSEISAATIASAVSKPS